MLHLIVVVFLTTFWSCSVAVPEGCQNAEIVVANFADQALFDKDISSLGTTIEHGQHLAFTTYERVTLPDPALRLIPSATSGVFFPLAKRPDCFQAVTKEGYQYTSIQFWAKFPKGGSAMVKLLGDPNGNCNGARSVELQSFQYSPHDDLWHRARINLGTQLRQGTVSIMFNTFSPVGGEFLIRNILLIRDCDVIQDAIMQLQASQSSSAPLLSWLIPLLGVLVVVVVSVVAYAVVKRAKIMKLRLGMDNALKKSTATEAGPAEWAAQHIQMSTN
uniref:MAM domain-containing protein n=1 Tax=Spongospora subterranea TaxID=70186 RepID=A0A0H5RE33_9EUKA|eukprot:CRZ12026.1 hypothetical protein [Spongospora subterranea]